MSLTSIVSLKVLSGFATAAAVVGGGTLGYIHQDTILDFVKHKLLKQQRNYEYIVASITSRSEGSADLYIADRKEFSCSITINEKAYSDPYCEIYKLNKGSDKDTIAFEDVNESAKVRARAVIKNNNKVLLKVSKAFRDRLSSTNSSFELLNDSNKKIADLKWEFDLDKNQTNSDTSITESSLMMIKLTGGLTTSNVNTGNSYSCVIGTGATDINCKIYKATDTSAAYTHENLKTLSLITNSDTSITTGHYLIVDLLGSKQSFATLDNKEIVIKNGSQDVAKGHLDNLLIGNLSTRANSSFLFKLSDKHTGKVVTVGSNQNYILTKFSGKHIAAPASITANDFLCRVVVDDVIYQDDSCELYKFGESSTTSFDLTTLTADGKKISSDYTELTSDKYQIVKVAQTIIDKLNTPSTTPKQLEILQKTKKAKSFNNQYVTLEHKGLLTSGKSSNYSLHSNLFVARVKTKGAASTGTTAEAITNTKCTIDGDDFGCNVYKLGSSAVGNKIAATDLSSMSNSITTSTDFETNKYVVIELTNGQKSFSDLKNKTIELKKSGSSVYATLEFDQQVFGYVDGSTKYIVPNKASEVGFVVSKGTEDASKSWEDANIDANARCKLSAVNDSGHIDNYDSSCKLIQFTAPADGKSVTELSKLHELASSTHSTLKLKDNTDGFYKLIFDANKLYNLDLTSFADQVITIELQDAAGTKTYGLVKLEQQIESATVAHGKTKLLLGKVAEITTDQVVSSSKCKFSDADTEGFECTLYKNTNATSASDKDKVTFTDSVSGTASFAANDLYGIQLTDAKDLSELSGLTSIYFEQPASGSDSAKKVKFTIENIFGGEFGANKKLYSLKAVS